MTQVEGSTLSKSKSTISGDQSTRVAYQQGNASPIDVIFPLMDNIYKRTTIPRVFYYLLIAFVVVQCIVVSFWPGFINLRYFDTPIGKVLQIISDIVLIKPNVETEKVNLIQFIIVTVLFGCFLLSLLFQTIIYHNQRTFVLWVLYLSRFFIEFVPLILIVPLSNLVGNLFLSIIEQVSATHIILFVLSFLYWIAADLTHYITSYFSARSAYLSVAPTQAWQGKLFFSFVTGFSVVVFLSYVLEVFTWWLRIVIVIGKVIFDLYLVSESFYHPFVQRWVNSFFGGNVTGLAALDIIYLIQAAGVKIDYPIQIGVLLGVVIIANVAFYYIMEARYRKVASNLRVSSTIDVEPTEDAENPDAGQKKSGLFLQNVQIRQHFLNLGLHKNINRARLYLRLGLAENSELFVDWSLVKFLTEHYQNSECYCQVIQMLAFFPCENRLMSYYYGLATSRSDISWENRFLLYQVHRIKGLRQSSASAEITQKLLSLKQMMQAGISQTIKFWSAVPSDIGIFYTIHASTNHTQTRFREAMENWPNNIRVCEDYSNFLIEGCTDFSEGLKMIHRGSLIELGKNFVIDLSFRSLVRLYPQYLKKNIVDTKGNFILKQKGTTKGSGTINTTSSSNSFNGSQISTGTIDGQLDIELEESLAKGTFTDHRLRLAFQRALTGRYSHNSYWLKVVNSILLVIIFTIGIGLFLYYYDAFRSRSRNMVRQLNLNNIRYGYDAALSIMIIKWANDNGIIPEETFKWMQSDKGTDNVHNLNLRDDLIAEVRRWNNYAQEYMHGFISSMIQFAIDGKNVRKVMKEMIEKTVEFRFCIGDKPAAECSKECLRTASLYSLMMLSKLSTETDSTKWGTSTAFCELISSFHEIAESFQRLGYSISDETEEQTKASTYTNMWIVIIGCVVYMFLSTPLQIYLFLASFKELKNIIKLMKDIDENSKVDAAKPIKLKPTFDPDTLGESIGDFPFKYWPFVVQIILPMLIGIAMFISVWLIAEDTNQNFLKLNEWLAYGIARNNYVLEIELACTLNIAKNKLQTNIYEQKDISKVTEDLISQMLECNRIFLRGTRDFPGCIGYSEEIDRINLNTECQPANGEQFHDSYTCSSLDQFITLFGTLASQIAENPAGKDFEPNGDYWHMFHIANQHMGDKIFEASEILSQQGSNQVTKFRQNLSIAIFTIMGITIIGFIVFWMIVRQLDSAYQGALQLLRRLPPLSVVSNAPLLNFLMNKKNNKRNEKMKASMSVVHLSKSAVICINKSQSIEVVNESVSNLFGYTPEQLLGQNISILLPQESASEVHQNIDLMIEGHSKLIFECSCTGITDNDSPIPVHVTVLGITDGNSGAAQSFALIIRDETLLRNQKQDAESAKAASEKLLYQILPRDIVSKLNAGESDITFVVPSASVIFIDIVKFSEYSSLLAPNQIMDTLSTIFAAFDSLVHKYPLITKIKLIGDVYMAAAGLFSPNENPTAHATQTVQFALDALVALEECNSQLNTNLQVRIGINTDGPLIAGVLGTDKPVFDIIGDPINVAARLQSTGIPGKVQISQGTFEAIQGNNFNVEARGEIELKGKGKRKAYIVHPVTLSSFFLSAGPSMSLLTTSKSSTTNLLSTG